MLDMFKRNQTHPTVYQHFEKLFCNILLHWNRNKQYFMKADHLETDFRF